MSYKDKKPDAERYYFDVVRILMNNSDWVRTDYIAQLLDLDITSTRSIIAQMRASGYPIIGKQHLGVRIAKTDVELGVYIQRLEKEIETRMETLDNLNRLLKRGIEK